MPDSLANLTDKLNKKFHNAADRLLARLELILDGLQFKVFAARQLWKVAPYVEPPVPRSIWREYHLVYKALRRLARNWQPDFVLDIGASTGIWSDVVHHLFPASRFILIDPLAQDHLKLDRRYADLHPEFEWVDAAVSNRVDEQTLLISSNLYGSSLKYVEGKNEHSRRKVKVTTVDVLAKKKQLHGRGLMKIDVQFGEHQVLEGAKNLLSQIDAFIVELTLDPPPNTMPSFIEMLQIIDSLGFVYGDDVGGWRSETGGLLLQKDILFVRPCLRHYS
ncbi:FkbM family methyltransferase [Gloeobacter morelensis]|uniref:FkbM family methyltransferase n=1 Tax=Gloeobacter morelensis MG652769 TaxID=2781736 RepID=A0ABY3PLT6_9CYAN|nr:FkbM family methyltransferase [Gloeobacter morelensis]UFP94585.1 FkbM family methyltransferase [Gloeobacter morelensis MG652769]